MRAVWTVTAGGRTRPLLGPVSVSFPTPAAGWLLAVAPCRESRCTSLRMRATTDGGRRWHPAPAPPARLSGWPAGLDAVPSGPPGSVDAITFASALNGWAYGPGLWATHDGGRRWHRVATKGWSVISMAAAGRRVIAVFSCYRGHQLRFQVRSSPAGADAWRPVPGAAGAGLATVAAAGRTGYVSVVPLGRYNLIAPGRPVLLLAGPADGAARWRRRAVPCDSVRTGLGDFGAPLAAARGGVLVLACAGEPSAGLQDKRAYISADAGRHWRRLARLSSGGYLGSVSTTRAGTVLWSGQRSGLWVTRDHGRRWQLSLGIGGGDGLLVGMVSGRRGYAIADDLSPAGQLWLTADDGRTWTAEVIRQAGNPSHRPGTTTKKDTVNAALLADRAAR